MSGKIINLHSRPIQQPIKTGLGPTIDKYCQNLTSVKADFHPSSTIIKFNHDEEGLTGKGKAEVIVNHQVGFDQNRRLAGFLNMALRIHAWVQHGFKQAVIPPFVQQRIRNGVVKFLVFDGNQDINLKKQRVKGITISDIFVDLQNYIYHNGDRPERAARKVYKAFNLTKKEVAFAQKYYRSRHITEKAEQKNHVYFNLCRIAEEIAILTYAWEASNLLATKGGRTSRDYIENLKNISWSAKREFYKLLDEEKQDFKAFKETPEKVEKLRKDALALRRKKEYGKAKKLEREAFDLEKSTYYGGRTEFACRYRGRRGRPMFAKPGLLNFKEIITLLVSKAPLPKYFNDAGFLNEEGLMLFKIAELLDRKLSSPSLKKFSHLRELTAEEGDRMIEYRDKIVKEAYHIIERHNMEISSEDKKIRNLANYDLYPLPELLAEWTILRTILDTDNIMYPEFSHGLTFAEPEYGEMIKNPIEILHRAENYKLIYKNMLIKVQKWRDSKTHFSLARGRNNHGVVPHSIKSADVIRRGEATYLGYGDISNFIALYYTMHSDTVVNPQKTEWNSRNLLEKYIFGPNFWTYKDFKYKNKSEYYLRRKYILPILNKYIPKIIGRDDLWDFIMQIERWVRWTSMGSGVFFALYNLAQLTFAGGFIDSTVLPIFATSTAMWLAGKGMAYAFGKDYKVYQYVSVPRNYEFDPSEDLLFTLYCLIAGVTLVWDQGHFQQNDSTTGLIKDMEQKLRWQAQNARLLRSFLIWAWAYRAVLGPNQILDAVSPCIYNNFGMAGTFYRTGIWSLMLAGATSMLMLRKMPYSLLGKNLLDWIIDKGITNYALIEAAIRFSNLREGTPWLGTTLNFGYEKVYIPFNFINVQKRLWSNESAAFNVTGALLIPARTPPWGTVGAPFHLRQNFDAMGVNAYVTYRVLRQAIGDGILRGDMMSLLGGTIAFWLLLDLIYNFKGMVWLNDGIEPIDVDEQFLEGFNKRIKAAPIKNAYIYDATGNPVTSEKTKKIAKGKDSQAHILDAGGNPVPLKEIKKIASGRKR